MENPILQQYKSMIVDMPDGVLIIGLDGCIETVNPAAVRVLKREEKDMVGLSFASVFFEDERNDLFCQCVLDAIYDKDTVQESVIPYYATKKTLAAKPLSIRSSFIKSGEEKIAVIVTVSDVTGVIESQKGSKTDAIQSLKHVQAIWRITEILRKSDALDAVLAECLEVIAEGVGCQAGSVWFVHKDDERIYATFHIGEENVSGLSVGKGQGVVGEVFETGESVISEDIMVDERFADEDTVDDFVTKSVICVPLRDAYETLGVILLKNKKDGTGFNDQDLKLCEEMAALADIAISEKGFAFGSIENKPVLISLKGVTKDYKAIRGVTHALRGIDLDIYENEFLVILGESGCGKTTLMNIIGGVERATSGTIRIGDQDFSRPSARKMTKYRRKSIGYVFQNYNLMPNLTAIENVQFVSETVRGGMSPKEAIELVGLSKWAKFYPAQLSGGQQQRVSIARAIVKNPTLILADEPTAALDFETSREILTVFSDIVREQGKTVVVVTHNSEIAKMANRVIKMKNGLVTSIRVNMHPASVKELSW